jgi:CheY-like chemotaxis protein
MTEAARGKTILVVEDDTATREALVLVLSGAGFTVASAANGQEALTQLHGELRPDLILLDLMMPVIDGWQFRREQVRDPALSAIPVVVLSADGNVQQKAASLRAAGFLQKPVDPGQLMESIRRHF